MKQKIFDEIEDKLQNLQIADISDERKAVLRDIVAFIQNKTNAGQEVNLNFICTHNSRRSHLAQVWAQAISCYFGIPSVFCYSGGTEATALFPATAEALRASGFQVQILAKGTNPVYSIKFSPNAHSVVCFSKTYDDPFNPRNSFAAVMTCSQADVGCPLVLGAEKRISLTFEDPKVYDDTDFQAEKYQERSLQIASEMMYVFKRIQIKSYQ